MKNLLTIILTLAFSIAAFAAEDKSTMSTMDQDAANAKSKMEGDATEMNKKMKDDMKSGDMKDMKK